MTAPLMADDGRVLDIQEIKTPLGINVWHVEDHSLPIITINFAFKGAGAINDPEEKVGLGQIVSNVLDEGAGARDAHAFQTALQDHAIDLSFANGRDHFTGKLKTLVKHKVLAGELLRDALTVPRFETEAINRMKNANIMRIKSSLANTDWLASRLMNDVYFSDHTYARNSGGTISGIASLTADDMRAFLTQYLTFDRLTVSIAGDISQQEAKIWIDEIFGQLPSRTMEDVIADVKVPEMPVKKAFKTDSPQSSVQMIWPSFPKSDPDYYTLRVFNHLLGSGGFSSALMEEVREKRGLTYGIYSRPVHMDAANYLTIESATSVDNVAPMMEAITDVLKDFKMNPVSEEQLKDAKNYLIGSMSLKFSSTQSLSRTALAMRLDDLNLWYLDEWNNRISSVTVEDIQRVANRIFVSTTPKATVIAGAVPEGQGFELIEKMPGIE